MIYRRLLKPFTDIIIGLFLLLLSSPFILILCFISFIKFGSGLFIQKRLGYLSGDFSVYKIRTLAKDKPSTEEEKVSTYMRILRQSGLDELPQLLNIVKGEMSLVGPRPLLVSYKEEIERLYPERFRVKPGLTGLVQVKGRNSLGWKQKFEIDQWYSVNQSFLLDLKILVSTALLLIKRRRPDPGSDNSVSPFKDFDKE